MIVASEHSDALHARWLRQDGGTRRNCLGAKVQGASAPAAAFLRGALAPKINQLELAAHLGMRDPRTLGHYYAGDLERVVRPFKPL